MVVSCRATACRNDHPPETAFDEFPAEGSSIFRCLSTVAAPLELSDVPATIRRMGTGEPGSSGYWIDGPRGCPIGGPFDLWRPNYFSTNGEPPEDTAKLYPSLDPQSVKDVAVATVDDGATLDDVLAIFADRGPEVEWTVAHRYFSQWRKRVPFMPDFMQDIPLRPARTSPEPVEEFLEDWRTNVAPALPPCDGH